MNNLCVLCLFRSICHGRGIISLCVFVCVVCLHARGKGMRVIERGEARGGAHEWRSERRRERGIMQEQCHSRTMSCEREAASRHPLSYENLQIYMVHKKLYSMVELKTQKLAAPREGGSLRLFLPPSVLSTLTAAEISFKSPPARSSTSCQSGFGKDAGF